MSQIRINPAGGLKLRMNIRLSKETCSRTLEVGLHTANVKEGQLAAIIVLRILSMTGVGEAVWTLRNPDGSPVSDPAMFDTISHSRALRPATVPPILDKHNF